MGAKIAIAGKGGVGKTTVCAIMARLFAEDGFNVLAIDADPNTTLASAFGVPQGKRPVSLIDMKQLIAERTGTDRASVGAYFKLNPEVGDLPEKYSLKIDCNSGSSLKLLVLGGITQAGTGCACPEGAFLKALLVHTILQRKEVVLVDLAAGPEFMGRASVRGIDAILVVVEPGFRSIETALNITSMAKELGIKNAAAVINRITDNIQVGTIKRQLTNLPVLATINDIPGLREADLYQRNIFDAGGEIVEQLRDGKALLMGLIGANGGVGQD
jgi:CO dehydrogenase maturation factor